MKTRSGDHNLGLAVVPWSNRYLRLDLEGGLGYSAMAYEYGIASRAEAVAYLEHPVLGARLRECTRSVNAVEGRSAHDIFGSPDDLKFCSSMTLFAGVTTDNAEFLEALARFCATASRPV